MRAWRKKERRELALAAIGASQKPEEAKKKMEGEERPRVDSRQGVHN